MHAGCESLFTEDDVEQAADEGFDCVSCQPYVIKPAGEYQMLRKERRSQDWGALLWDRASNCLGLSFSPQHLLRLQSWYL